MLSTLEPSSSSCNPDYSIIMLHAKGCHLDEDCTYPFCFQMKLSMLHLYNCKRQNCEEISCKALASNPLTRSPPPAQPIEDKIKRAILLSDMLHSSKKTENEVGIKKPVPVYANEINQMRVLKSLSTPVNSRQSCSTNSISEKEAVEFYCRAYVDIFTRIAKAGKG